MSDSIVLPGDRPCAFCQYLAGVRPFTIWRRDDTVAALVTREQRGEPHLLVIPVRHVSTVLELTTAENHAIMDLVQGVSRAIDRAYAPRGLTIWQNNGVDASQSIGHVHFHVAGTLEGGGTNWGDVPELSVRETSQIAAKLDAPDEGASGSGNRGPACP